MAAEQSVPVVTEVKGADYDFLYVTELSGEETDSVYGSVKERHLSDQAGQNKQEKMVSMKRARVIKHKPSAIVFSKDCTWEETAETAARRFCKLYREPSFYNCLLHNPDEFCTLETAVTTMDRADLESHTLARNQQFKQGPEEALKQHLGDTSNCQCCLGLPLPWDKNDAVSEACHFCDQKGTVFHCHGSCSCLSPIFAVLVRLFIDLGLAFSDRVGYGRKRKIQTLLANFLVGQAKLTIYKTLKNKISGSGSVENV